MTTCGGGAEVSTVGEGDACNGSDTGGGGIGSDDRAGAFSVVVGSGMAGSSGFGSAATLGDCAGVAISVAGGAEVGGFGARIWARNSVSEECFDTVGWVGVASCDKGSSCLSSQR